MNADPAIRVAVVGGTRTPFAKAGTAFKQHTPLDLSVHAVDGLLEIMDLDPEAVEELVHGITVVDARVPHLAREVVFSSRLPVAAKALTVTNNCITGTSAIASIYDSIASGRAEVGLASGVESMSNPAVLFSERASRIFLDADAASSVRDKLAQFAKLRPGDFIRWCPADS